VKIHTCPSSWATAASSSSSVSVSKKLASTDNRNVCLASVGASTDIINGLLGTIETTIGDVISIRDFRSLTIACSFPSGTVVELARSSANARTEKEQTTNVSSAWSAEFRETRRQRMEEQALIFLDVRPNHHLPWKALWREGVSAVLSA